MILLRTNNYTKQVLLLEKKDKVFLLKQEKILIKNIFDPKLHTKKLKGFPEDHIYSFRITRSYRGIFRLQEESIILFAIGHVGKFIPRIKILLLI
jgi:mRNA-degrading endonuclease RelE of RelBE toxin-antitoxin system